jgi:hypothetical protein
VSDQVCSLCHRPVIWATTVYEKPIPLDPDPDPDGNQFVYRDGSGALRTRQRKKGQEPQPFERIHMPHVATCAARRKAPAPPANVTPITAARSLQRGYRYPRRTP